MIGLFTVGYLPLGSALLGIAWTAAAAQVAALAVGRYAPYAGGVETPPAGLVRRALARASLVEREEANEAARRDLPFAARDVDERVRDCRTNDHVRLLPRDCLQEHVVTVVAAHGTHELVAVRVAAERR